MSDNPLEDDPARDARIKERAYHLWKADGEPHGRHDEYWERASELTRMEDSGRPGQLPNPTTRPGFDPTATEPVEEAFIQENLGEFPDRFADQGESQPTPKAKHAARATAAEDGPPTGAAGRDKPTVTAKPTPAAKPEAAKSGAATSGVAKSAHAESAAPSPEAAKSAPAATPKARKPKS